MEPGTKHFRKRDAILSCLRMSKAHPSAEDLFVQLKPQIPDLSIGTVYRNLSLFKQQGLATSVAIVKGVERFDSNIQPHVHFVCTDCSAVIDMPQMQVPVSMTQTAEKQIGGRVDLCQLSFTGLCRECLTNIKGGETA